MSFRDDGDALRERVESLEDELERTKQEAEQLREERDRALSKPRLPTFDARPGSKLWVEWRGTWWPATVVHEVGQGLIRIHYDGWSTRWDENVEPTRIAPRDRPPPGKLGGLAPSSLVFVAIVLLVIGAVIMAALGSPATRTSPPGVVLLDTRVLSTHSEVWIEWGGSWYEGTVLEVEDEAHVDVHYDGWSDESDDTVPIERVRLR